MNTQVVNDLIKTRNIIRNKYQALKSGKQENALLIEEVFQPIIEPIKKISEDKNVKNKYTNNMPTFKQFKKDNIKAFDNDADTDNVESDEKMSESDLEKYKHKTIKKEYSNIYGLRYTDDRFMIGNTEVKISSNNEQITVGNTIYPYTIGLEELLIKKKPDLVKCKKEDLLAYAEIAKQTNLLHRNFDKKYQLRGSKSSSYKLLKQLLTSPQRDVLQQMEQTQEESGPYHDLRSGTGLMMQYSKSKPDYIYWDNPNELVNRLRLLIASHQAGHNNHSNEITSILEELKEAKIII